MERIEVLLFIFQYFSLASRSTTGNEFFFSLLALGLNSHCCFSESFWQTPASVKKVDIFKSIHLPSRLD